MTRSEIMALLLGSAVISGIVGALINGVFNAYLKRWELRESRLKIASELTRLNQERYIEAYRNSPGAEVALQDPATVLRFYLAELDEITAGRRGVGTTK